MPHADCLRVVLRMWAELLHAVLVCDYFPELPLVQGVEFIGELPVDTPQGEPAGADRVPVTALRFGLLRLPAAGRAFQRLSPSEGTSHVWPAHDGVGAGGEAFPVPYLPCHEGREHGS